MSTLLDHMSGNPLLQVQRRLGHASPATTYRYIRYLKDPIGNVLVEAETTWGNLRVPVPQTSEVPLWRSAMPTVPGRTAAQPPYAPIVEFQLNAPVVVPPHATKPVLKLTPSKP